MACGRDLFDFNGTFSGAGHGTFVGPRAAGARLVGAPPQASGREKFDFSIFRHLCAYQLVLAGNRQYQPLKCERCAAARTGFGCGVYHVNTTRRSLLFVCFCFRNTCLVLGAKCVRGLGCWPWAAVESCLVCLGFRFEYRCTPAVATRNPAPGVHCPVRDPALFLIVEDPCTVVTANKLATPATTCVAGVARAAAVGNASAPVTLAHQEAVLLHEVQPVWCCRRSGWLLGAGRPCPTPGARGGGGPAGA